MYKAIELKVPGSSDRCLKDIPINDLGEGSIFGEEILMGESSYQYTVKVETNVCRLLVFDRNANMKDFATKFLHKILVPEYYEKVKNRTEKISNILNSHPEKYMISQVTTSNPTDAIDEMRLKILGTINLLERRSILEEENIDLSKKVSYTKSIEKYVATHKKMVHNCDPIALLYNLLT